MTKTKIKRVELCVRVAGNIGWENIIIYADNGDHANSHVKRNPQCLVDMFLSPQGRELMEQEAEKLGWGEFRWTGIFWFFDKHPNSGSDWIAGHHTDKHTACLLAFAQLVKVYDPETEEVVDE